MEKLLCLNNYLKFKCKCDKCRHTCCAYWKINASKKDYDRIRSIDNGINHLEVESFPTSKRYAYIKLNSSGKCPCLSKEGLCSLQIKYGTDALTTICMSYPRVFRYINSPEVSLSTACEGVLEDLMSNELITFERIDKKYMYDNKYSSNQKFIKKNSVRNKVFDIYMKEGINALSSYLGINYDISFNKRLFSYLKNIYDEFFKERAAITGYHHFMDDVSYDDINIADNIFIKNIMINHMFYMNFPFCNNNENIKENFIGLLTVEGMVKVAFSILKGEELVDELSFLFRGIEHSNFYDKCYGLFKELM